MSLKGSKTNINITICKVINRKKILIKKGMVRKKDDNYLIARYTNVVYKLLFGNGQKYYIRINYDNKPRTQNTNHGFYINRKELILAWDNISSKDVMEFMETDI